jgi:predicted Zn-dependent peptidase
MLDDVSLTTLPNGCRVITSAIPHVESVSVGIWTGVGGRHESAAESGHSHFLEHMLFKGTARRSAKQISQAVEGRGGYLNAFTQQESTCYYARVPAEATALALDVLADMATAPRLAPDDVDRERTVILEELAMYRDQPDAHIFDMAGEALWARHPLGRPLIGNKTTLAAVTRESLDAFRRRHYTATATVFAAAGKLDHETFVDRVRPYAAQLPAGRATRFRAASEATPQTPTAFDAREIEQVHLVIAFRGFGRHDPRRHALRLLNVVLGENMSSRLFQVLREKHGLAYSIASSLQLHDDAGALLIGAGLEPARALKATALCADELQRLCDRPIGRAEFNRARDYILGQLRLGMETPENHMTWLGETLMGYGRFIPPDETVAGTLAVAPTELQALAQELFRRSRATMALISPKGQAHAVDRYHATLDALPA